MAPRWAGSPREDSPCDSPSRTTEDPHQGRHRTGEHLSILGGVSLKGRFSLCYYVMDSFKYVVSPKTGTLHEFLVISTEILNMPFTLSLVSCRLVVNSEGGERKVRVASSKSKKNKRLCK